MIIIIFKILIIYKILIIFMILIIFRIPIILLILIVFIILVIFRILIIFMIHALHSNLLYVICKMTPESDYVLYVDWHWKTSLFLAKIFWK